MKNNFKKTKKYYLNWLEKTQLRSIFSKNMIFDNFSIWWITKLVVKDNILDNNWYLKLNGILNNQKVETGNKNVFPNIILIFRLIKKFIAIIIFVTLVKIFFHHNILMLNQYFLSLIIQHLPFYIDNQIV